MSSSLVFSGVGLNDTTVGLPPAVYLQRGEKHETGSGVDKGADAAPTLVRKRSVFSCIGEEEEEEEEEEAREEVADAGESSESSSIGVASSSEEDDGEEVESKKKEGAFGSLDSLDDSLPIKRGLSNFFSGKSKSFANLSDVASASSSDLVKPENPFNKKRRILMAFKARRASYGSLMSVCTSSSSSMSTLLSPDHAVAEEGDEEEEEEEGEAEGLGGGSVRDRRPTAAFASLNYHGRGAGEKKPTSCTAFRSHRSFSLSDLRHGQ